MIEAEAHPPVPGFAARFARKAATLAEARAEERLRARKRDPWRWRRATLLWPLFGKD